MDANRLDDLVVALSLHRRIALRTMLAGATAALLGRVEAAVAGLPVCKAPGDSCKKAIECCSNGCKKKRGRRNGKCRARVVGTGDCAARGVHRGGPVLH